MNAKKLKEICLKHIKWIRNEEGGEKAELRGADLTNANLSGAYLAGANLAYVKLSGANMTNCDLSGANLFCANLSGSELFGADFRRSNLKNTDLSVTNLYGANLGCSELSGAKLPHKYILVGPIGSRNDTTIYSYEYDVIRCGCFNGTLKEFIKNVCETYPKGHKHRIEYEAAIAMIKKLKPLYEKDK